MTEAPKTRTAPVTAPTPLVFTSRGTTRGREEAEETPRPRSRDDGAGRVRAAAASDVPMSMLLAGALSPAQPLGGFTAQSNATRRGAASAEVAPQAENGGGGILGSLSETFSNATGYFAGQAREFGGWLQNTFTSASRTVSGLLDDIADATVGRFRYALGGTGRGGAIDCSNYTRMCVDSVTDVLRQQGRIDARTEAAIDRLFQTTSEGQLVNMMRYGNRMSEGQLLNGGLQAGMMLFMDTGRTRFDAGRQHGTDHVAYTFRDESGRLMVAESRGGRGTTISDAESYVERMAARGNITAVSLDQVMTNVAAQNGLRLELT